MRPLRIELEGFGPYLKRQEIPLDDVDLFVITGPTGSGKSTLLEAMTFALFGAVPRLGKRGLEEILHPRASRAWAALTFRLEGKVYRVERELSRKGAGEASLVELRDGKAFPLASRGTREVTARVERLLGLDYGVFIRAVFLPQGEFDQLLRKAPGRERRQILDRLFGLEELGEMRKLAGERVKELEGRAKGLEEELKRLEEERASEETLRFIEESLARSRENRERLRERKKELTQQKARWEELIRHLEGLEKAQAELKEERRKEPDLREAWAQAQASREARGHLERWEEFRAKEAALKEVEERLEELKRRRTEEEAEERRLQEEAGRLGVVLHELEQALQALREEEGKLPWLAELQALLQEAGDLPRPAPSFPFQPGMERALRKALLEADQLAKQAAELEGALDLARNLEETEARLLSARFARLRRARENREALRKEVADLREKVERLGLRAHRHLLRLGEPCPLCEGVVQALPPAGEAPEVETLRTDLREKEMELARAEEEVARLEGLLADREDPGLPEDPRGEEELEREAQRIRGRLGLWEEAATARASEKDLAQARQERDRAREEAGALARALEDYLGGHLGGRDLAAYREELRRRREALEGLQESWRSLQKRLGELEREEAGVRARLEERRKEWEKAWRKVQDLPPEEDLKGRLLSPEAEDQALSEWEENRRRLRELGSEVERWEEGLSRLSPLPDPLPAPQERMRRREELEQKMAALEEALSRLDREIGRLEEQAKELERKIARRKEAEERLAEVRKELDLWQPLLEDLRQEAFPEWLYRRLQKNLLARANRLLEELSQGRYRLDTQEKGGLEYRILDLWTEAWRSADTLSGGEAFLASLALALALSEELAGSRLEALFLDEGFGTLDAETLELVGEVLESLGSRGRMLGVITHVKTLAERFPNRLRVRKARGESEAVWEA
ncbi:exonuclease SbcC [Thermus arciformis]|uniref:Exonuclease SbcC n=1 Tax=Thermus arciformis TaxID=482827 RepID=A0A1G7L8K0_9DEIN|nr:SMC family ATPase [Thermus arciformis]SDF45837.1 exonuclease SbcC [Thermus arciformis]